jgi:hypothetical protein
MAKVKLNSALRELRGNVDGLIFKQYKKGIVVSRSPRMGHIKASPAQLAQRERFRGAAKFHREVLEDPREKRRFSALATKRGMPLSAVTFAAYLKRSGRP